METAVADDGCAHTEPLPGHGGVFRWLSRLSELRHERHADHEGLRPIADESLRRHERCLRGAHGVDVQTAETDRHCRETSHDVPCFDANAMHPFFACFT
jgi:hypothetical protein